MMSTIRVILADDHAVVRAGLRSLLKEIPGVEVVAEAGDGLEALALIEVHRPDLLLIDITMPRLGRLEVAARVSGDPGGPGVIILSMHEEQEYVRRAIHAGARGYLLKDSDEHELALAIRAGARGEIYLSPRIAGHVISDYLQRASGTPPPAPGLTPRQRDVLRLIAEGEPTKGIARRLGISVKTAETHRTQLMERLGIHEIAGLVRYAIREGIIPPG